jgi:hypothetical protein
MQEIRVFNKKRDIDVAKKEGNNGNDKIRVEYFNELRKTFTKFKR